MFQINPNIKKIIYFDIFLFLICIAGIYHVIEKAGFNPVNDIDWSISDEGKLVIEQVFNDDLTSLVQSGDTLLSVNDYRVSSHDGLEIVTDSYKIGDQIDIHLNRTGGEITHRITLDNFFSLSYIIIITFVGCVFLFLGLIVLIKKPDDTAGGIFHWVSVSVAIIIMATWGRYTIEPIGLGHFLRIIFCAAYAFTPALFFHFSLIFPRQKWNSINRVIIPIYFIAVFLSACSAISFLMAVVPEISIDKIRLFILSFDTIRWFFATCIVLGVINLIHSLTTTIDFEERRKILWIMLGLVVGPLSFVFLWQIPQALGYSPFVPEEIIILIASIMPLTFSISILRYHIMDIDLIINRSTVYGIVVFFLITVYALIIVIAMALIDTFTTISSLITSAIAAVILGLIFEPIRKMVQKFIDKKFFRVKYNYRIAQRRFTDEMNQSIDLRSIALFTVENLDELLNPGCVGLLLKEKKKELLEPIALKNCDYLDNSLIKDLQEQILTSSQQIFSHQDQLEPGIQYKDLAILAEQKISLILPIRTQSGSILGLLILGRKKSENYYSLEDIDLLKTIISQLGLAIERIRLQSRLILKQEEAKRLDDLNKMQSFFISSISHDLQTPLTAINMYIDLLQERKNISEPKKREYLDTISGESDRLSKLINNVLDVSRIERGVKQYQFSFLNIKALIHDVLKSMEYQLRQHNFDVHLDFPDGDIHVSGDYDSIERMFINLISNAIKYSTKNKYLSIRIFSSIDQIGIEIADKGVGISTEDKKKIFYTFYRSNDKHIQSLGGAGLGLAIVKHVVDAHSGKVELESTPGKGSKFTIWLPTKM